MQSNSIFEKIKNSLQENKKFQHTTFIKNQYLNLLSIKHTDFLTFQRKSKSIQNNEGLNCVSVHLRAEGLAIDWLKDNPWSSLETLASLACGHYGSSTPLSLQTV